MGMRELTMWAPAAVLLTPDGWRKLHDDLAGLRARKDQALAAQAQALAGSSSEEVAEAASPAEIEYLEHCINELEWVLARAEPVEDHHREPGVVSVGAEVDVRWDDGDHNTLMIVGSPEVAPRDGRISYESPVGQALMGRRSGDRVAVAIDKGTAWIDVVSVR